MKLLSSLAKALQVLEAFSSEQSRLSTIELSRILKMDKSSVSRIVTTLRFYGYLEKDESNKYHLGMKFLDLGNLVLEKFNKLHVSDAAAPFLQELSSSVLEVVHLGILVGHEVLTLRKIGGGQIVTVDTKVGGRYPAYSCGLGKVLLAGLPEDELKKRLGTEPLIKRTQNTTTDIPTIISELKIIKSQGYAFEDEESFIGICCLAVPVYDYNGNVAAAISATIPKQRASSDRLEEILVQIKETGRKISREIGGTS